MLTIRIDEKAILTNVERYGKSGILAAVGMQLGLSLLL